MNGDPPPGRAPTGHSEVPTGSRPIKIFFSYASEDDAHRIDLEKHLTLLQRQRVIEPWTDRKILAGQEWGRAIAAELENADVILLLVSANFLASRYCYEIEMQRGLERHQAGEARVIPVILDHCDWDGTPFAKLQALPERARPITDWPNHAEAWTDVARGIRRIAQQVVAASSGEVGRPLGPGRYLAALKEQNSYVEIRGLGAKVAERMDLAQVYTSLQVSVPGRERGEARRGHGRSDAERSGSDESLRADHHRELRDVLAEHPHAALVGDPGSGKTTFLRYVAQHLARAHLGETEALERIGLAPVAPFPVFVRIERVAHFLSEHPDASYPDDAPEHFYRYLEHMLAGQPYGLPDDYLRQRVLGGGCFLLLDGLDEVPGQAMRERLVRLIEQIIIAGKAVSNRHLITCRTRAYEGRVRLAGDVTTFRLAPLGEVQVERFAEGWSRALFRVDPHDAESPRAGEAARYRDELLGAIAENPSGATFAESPLMLTVLAVVHWNRRRLPEQRAELYDHALEYLLESRRELSSYATPVRRECLQAVAIAMFEDPEGVQRSLGRRDAAEAVRAVLAVDAAEATAFLENEELYSGVLVSRTEGEVEFWHLTFQEYLAALELSQAEDGWARLREHLYDDRWSEVVLLLAGCERRQGGLRGARRLIQRVLDTGRDRVSKARAVGLIGRVLRDIRPYGGEPEQGTDYERMLRETLSIFEPGGETVPEPTRVEVGEALGQAGDPRLVDESANRVFVAGGTLRMGSQSSDQQAPGFDPEGYADESPVRPVGVREFYIGRYPVTVQEFGEFLDDREGGYMNGRHWHPDGWAWRESEVRMAPGSWKAQLSHPNRPVTFITWYEADAYSRWAGGRLPTEAEWEWVARGDEARRCPWGNAQPTSEHANFDLRVGGPTPVGIYPRDSHEHGVRDLAGNVWEWCSDWYSPHGSEPTGAPTEHGSGPSRVLRGGSFVSGGHHLRASLRLGYHPDSELGDFGFRVVWSPP